MWALHKECDCKAKTNLPREAYDPIAHKKRFDGSLKRTPGTQTYAAAASGPAVQSDKPKFQLSDNLQKALAAMSTSDTTPGASFLSAYNLEQDFQ